jgi:sulfoxide reductase heme-binding subunit YedZ
MNAWLRALKPWGMGLLAVPALALWTLALADRLGANPAEALIRTLGDWALWLLCATLAVTPLRQLSGWTALAAWRRGLGLWSFAYALQHLLAYLWLDQGLDWRAWLADVAQRPFIAVGMLAWLGLLALAATSSQRAVRWLGAARWRRLHRSIYAIALLALLHFFWMRSGKRVYGEVLLAALVLALLLGWRIWAALSRAPARAPGARGH